MNRLPTSQTDNDDNLGANTSGITALDIADLPDPQRSLMNAILRLASTDGVSVGDLQAALPNIDAILDHLADLEQRGFLRVMDTAAGASYHANLRRKPRAKKGVNWDKLMGDG
jgi:hypothetical protein